MGGQGAQVADADPKMAQRPGVAESHEPDCHGPAASLGGGGWHDGETDAASDGAADGVETGQPDPELQRAPGACRMATDMLLQGAAGDEPDEVMAQCLSKSDLAPLAQRMLVRRHQDQPILDKGECLQFGGGVDGVGHDADIGLSTGHGAHDLCTRPLVEIEIDVGMRCQEGGKRARQEFEGRRGIGKDTDPAAQSLGILVELAAHQFDLLSHGAGVVDECIARRRRADTAALALEQGGAKRFFHVPDALAGRGQRQAASCRAMGDARRFGHVQHQAEVGQIEPHPGQVRQRPAFGQTEGRARPFRIVPGPAGSDGAAMTAKLWIAMTAVFLLAGLVKGVIGMGLPTVAMGLLALALPPAEAAAILVVPSLVTNVWQLLAGSRFTALARRLWPMMLGVTAGTVAGAGILAGDASRMAEIGLAIALMVYAIVGLTGLKLIVTARHEAWLAPTVGVVTGLVTGATGVFVIPAVPYLQAIGLEKDELIQALGLSFTVSTVALAIGLWRVEAWQTQSVGLSVLALVPALAGMQVGQVVRRRIAPSGFRTVFFAGLLLLGLYLVLRGLA